MSKSRSTLAHQAFGGNLREIICGGAPIRPEIGKFFNDIGITLLNGYGITECSPLVSVNRLQFNDSSTVGVILPCCEVKLENVTADGDGEICVKGDIVMKGYYKDPEKTNRVLKDGWFNTEDYGHVNKKGQLVINGRKKNLIVLDNGKNVYPEEIENYILGIQYVQEVVVKGKKNKIGQEKTNEILNKLNIGGDENMMAVFETIQQDNKRIYRRGKKEGIKQGIMDNSIAIAKKLLSRNNSKEEIAEITGLKIEEIEKIK